MTAVGTNLTTEHLGLPIRPLFPVELTIVNWTLRRTVVRTQAHTLHKYHPQWLISNIHMGMLGSYGDKYPVPRLEVVTFSLDLPPAFPAHYVKCLLGCVPVGPAEGHACARG